MLHFPDVPDHCRGRSAADLLEITGPSEAKAMIADFFGS